MDIYNIIKSAPILYYFTFFILVCTFIYLYIHKKFPEYNENIKEGLQTKSHRKYVPFSSEDSAKINLLLTEYNTYNNKILNAIKFYYKTFLYGCVICSVSLIWPIFLVFGYGWRNPKNQKLVYSIYNKVCNIIFGIHYEVKGIENLSKYDSYVIVSNHQSSLDLLSQSQVWPLNCTTIAKREVIYLGPFGALSYSTGVVYIDRKNLKSAKSTLDNLAQRLKHEKLKVWIFSEGTRNHGTGILPFKKGAFHLAVQAQVPICPVVFSSYYPFYCRQEKRFNSGNILVTCLPPIPTLGLVEDPEVIDHLIDVVRDKIVHTFMRSSALTYPKLFDPSSDSPLYSRWEKTEKLYGEQTKEKRRKYNAQHVLFNDNDRNLKTHLKGDGGGGDGVDNYKNPLLLNTQHDFPLTNEAADHVKTITTPHQHNNNNNNDILKDSLSYGTKSHFPTVTDQKRLIDKLFESEKYDDGFTDPVTQFLDEIFFNQAHERDDDSHDLKINNVSPPRTPSSKPLATKLNEFFSTSSSSP